MAGRLPMVVRDQNGNGLSGRTLQLFRFADNLYIGDFTDVGNGNYWIEHAISERVYVKDGGTMIAATNGMLFPAGDTVLLTDLAAITIGKGASLVGVQDAGSKFTSGTVEGSLAECATLAQLASTGASQGAALIGINDTLNYYTGTNVELALVELGPIKAALTALTSTAAELNKLHGASGNVTPTNLNTLTAGVQSDAGALHRHNMFEMLGHTLTPHDQNIFDLTLKAAVDQSDLLHNIILDTFKADQPGRVYVRKNDENDGPVLGEIITSIELGDQDYSGVPGLSGITGTGKTTKAIRYLAGVAVGLAQQIGVGINRHTIWRGKSEAGSSAGSAAANPTTTTLYYEISNTPVVKIWIKFIQKPSYRQLRWRLPVKVDSGVTATVQLEVATEVVPYSATETTYKNFDGSIDIAALLPVTSETERWVKVTIKGNGTLGAYMNCDGEIWAEM